ncbi:MFS transporter [Microbulbifer sp. THAF38]|uniref:MFS transporter n=1 Tax=Microbulbifer sp. THAF38 TaxID=2587856 RepID=UPI001269834D|nr:MFS transporter [Microbulbifer sp. THAF38]QFT54493.1 putative MFS-type transporter EfpA [Microbulbifer sp. THAF38]
MAYVQESSQQSNRLGLLAIFVALFIIAIDISAFSPAVPAIEREMNMDITTSQWVINGYGLVFGVLVVTGGRIADIIGRRRTFIAGASIFLLFSLVGGLSINVPMLLASRAAMGVGAALMWPAILGMAYNLMPEERAGETGGLIMAVCGLANTLGPVVGGLLADLLSWRWIFFFNLPIATVAVYMCWKFTPLDAPYDPDEKIDYLGVVALTGSLLSFLLALSFASENGFLNPLVVGLLSLFLLFSVAFFIIEIKAGDIALIPPDIIENKRFLAAGAVTLFTSVTFFSVILYLPQFLSNVRGFSTIQSGLALVPMMVAFGLMSFVAGKLYLRTGGKLLVCVGILSMSLGMFFLSRLSQGYEYIFGLIILGAGLGLFNPSTTTMVIAIVNPNRASLASAIIYMLKITGGAVGLGVNAAILGFSQNITSGIGRAFEVNACFAFVGFVIAFLFMSAPRIPEREEG